MLNAVRYERILSKNFLLPPYHKHYFRGFLPACRASKQKSRFRAAHQPIKHTGRSPPFKFLIYYSYHVNLIICMRLTLSSIYPQPPNIPPRRNLASKVPPFTITLFVLKSTPQNHPPPTPTQYANHTNDDTHHLLFLSIHHACLAPQFSPL